MNVDFATANVLAAKAAAEAATDYSNKYFDGGDAGACGFAWVSYYPENKGNTKLGKAERKAVEAIGFEKNWTGKVWELWNPSDYRGQSVDAKFTGALAYAEKFLELTGVKLYAGDRLD